MGLIFPKCLFLRAFITKGQGARNIKLHKITPNVGHIVLIKIELRLFDILTNIIALTITKININDSKNTKEKEEVIPKIYINTK